MPTRAVLIAAITLAAAPVWAQSAQNHQAPPVIVTRGEATLKRAPDQAWVSIAAETRASTAAEAQRLAAEAMKAVQTSLSKAGLPADAIRTTGYNLHPDMEYSGGRARVRGYIVRNQIEVRVDDLQKLSAVLDAAGSSGATNMSGLRFDLKDRATAEREALRQAVQDAMARARAMAAGANVQIGQIVRIDETGARPGPIPFETMAMSAAAGAERAPTPVTPGEIEIRVQVTVTAAIR